MRVTAVAALILSTVVRIVGAAEPENSVRFYDDEDAAVFSSKMKELGIPFRRDESGAFWYPARMVTVVDEIRLAAHQRCGVGVNYRDARDAADFASRLEREAIPFKKCRSLGQEYIVWAPEFQARVNHIMEAVDDESMRRSAEERARHRNEAE